MLRSIVAASVAVWIAASFASPAYGGATPAQVLVVVNDASPISQAVGAYYAQVRAIPAINVFHLPPTSPTTELITRTQYNAQIRDPIKTYLSVTQPQLQTQIKYIVLTKGVPIRVTGTNEASVDSELTMLFSPIVGDNGQQSWYVNPYFNKKQSFASFTGNGPRYLVCRLDGYEDNVDAATGVPGDITGLIDRAQNPASAGVFLLDQDPSKGGGYQVGNDWMANANTQLTTLGQSIVFDQTNTFRSNVGPMLGYASWGSNDAFTAGAPYYGQIPAGTGPLYPGTFANGAIVTDYVSTNGRTFLKSGQVYGQSLIADLIHLGACGAAGFVAEPFLQACVHPDILFSRYLNGYDAAEAYYMAVPYLSWMNLVVVDPLMKSAIVAQFPPTITQVFPDRGDQAGGGSTFISGTYLGAAGDAVSVTIGGVPASAAFFGPDILQATVPPLPPGPHDVVVTVANGTATKVAAFLALPALKLGGSASIGQTANLDLNGDYADGYLVFLGAGTASLPAPPHGTFLLDPNTLLVPFVSGAFGAFQDRLTLPLPLPPDANLIGLSAHFQGVFGDLVAGSSATQLTNRVTLTIAP
ncbi:MAG: TIGR03790 family protein [Planctomycetes bacterium]|nr:TIGR03790 family protein [Planctomycetota bacterium]